MTELLAASRSDDELRACKAAAPSGAVRRLCREEFYARWERDWNGRLYRVTGWYEGVGYRVVRDGQREWAVSLHTEDDSYLDQIRVRGIPEEEARRMPDAHRECFYHCGTFSPSWRVVKKQWMSPPCRLDAGPGLAVTLGINGASGQGSPTCVVEEGRLGNG